MKIDFRRFQHVWKTSERSPYGGFQGVHKSFKNLADIDSLALGGVSWEVKIEENCWFSLEICVFREGVKIQHIRSSWAARKGSK